ncbi:hypothetical protein VP01_74g7 [Puccinia sorghi]|uniref:Uncharacterized protein n=1 Tax=Puccinia sorghi TaxID=27349 RepID=A0A0L6UC66_9BASI|nr:hypothetical protein VP01_74g7 [Puccinia sorghi]
MTVSIQLFQLVVLIGLLIFNVFTQGKVEKSEGDHVSCQPALVKVDDNFFMVLPPDENDTLVNASIEELQIAVRSNMSFKWTLVEVGDEPNTGSRKAATGFLYRGERTNCTVNFVKSTYQFQDTNYQYM